MKNIMVIIARRFFSRYKFSVIKVRRKLPSFVPNSGADFENHVNLTIAAANETPSLLGSLSGETIRPKPKITNIRDMVQDSEVSERSELLASIFNAHGSDKADHLYHFLYASLFTDPLAVQNVFEIGIGTPNLDVPSNMGLEGRPGASLRAFRDYFPKAKIVGADLDLRVLFEEERISTIGLDQTDDASFRKLEKNLLQTFDLIIDDGLHSPHANLRTLNYAKEKIKPGGWVVIEDIHPAAEEIWRAAFAVLPVGYKPLLIRAKENLVFAVQREG